MTYEFDFLVFIGRFQPFHNGHARVITDALIRARRVIVLVGSANRPRSFRNPWTFRERAAMIGNTFDYLYTDPISERLIILPIEDNTYNETAWVTDVRSAVQNVVALYGDDNSKIGLIGMKKDHTSYYLDLFPTWNSVPVSPVHPDKQINATDIRREFFDRTNMHAWPVPQATSDFLRDFAAREKEYLDLWKERQFLKEHAAAWASAPYPPTFNTVDAVVTQSGFILLIERRAAPGKGLLAMPGGYINVHERCIDAVIRELREETRLKVPEPVLRGCTKTVRRYDDPNRSERGRIITEAYHFDLPPGELPKVRGGDDAKSAHWVPISTLDSSKMFEDHYDIIRHILGL